MTTEQLRLDVCGIAVEVVRKNIKHLYVGVYPPDGRVRVSAPSRIDKDAIRLAVISRLSWIRKKQSQFEHQERQSAREYVSGESHYFEGRRYRLDVIEQNSPPAVLLLNNTTLALSVRPGTDRVMREKVLDKWYRTQLRDRLPGLIDKWEKNIGVKINEIRIRKMKTRWGTCNNRDRRIWLNLELIKKPPSCLEYVVVHEIIHIIERNHNSRFCDLMNKHLPLWRTYRAQLNRAPLAHGSWEY